MGDSLVGNPNPFAANAFGNPGAVEALSAIPTAIAGAQHPSSVQSGDPTAPGKHITPDQINVHMILSKLDGDFVQAYLLKLEEAKSLLKIYLSRLGDFERRLEKGDAITRKVLGEDALLAKVQALEETIAKLNAHELASIKRLRNG